MPNRKLTSPILSALVLSLAVSSTVSAQQLLPIPLPPQTATPALAPETPASATTTPEADTSSTAQVSSENPSGPVSAPQTPETAAPTEPAQPPPHTTTYTVVKGDTLTKLAIKFNSTRKKLEALNNLTDSKIEPGQVLFVPSYKKSKPAQVAMSPTANIMPLHHESLRAQPVQDIDAPASAVASSPAPVPTENVDNSEPKTDEKPAPIAQLVSPSELQAETAKQEAANRAAHAEANPVANPVPTARPAASQFATLSPVGSDFRNFTTRLASTPAAAPAPAPSPTLSFRQQQQPRNSGGFFSNIFGNSTPATDWGARFLQQARSLGDRGIEYDEEWRPPGEARSWEMDCSNTTRYLYKVTTGLNLPRTASDQYYYLHQQGKAWDVPVNSEGWADGAYLREHLKPGDLLFWENTYRPERQPPITHVMVYLGVNAQGQWLMAGSQSSSGGEHNRRNGGPDIYVFRPSQPCGGYTTWLGMVHHHGRFCAFGRPLEADPNKLASD